MQLLKGSVGWIGFGLAASVLIAHPLAAQVRPVTRADAVTAALARGPRLAFAAADTGVAAGLLRAARAFPNPTLGASYTEDHPQYHVSVDLPVDYPWLRSTRIKAAESSRAAAQLRFRQEHEAAMLDADTLYTLAQASRARRELSRRNVLAADSLVRITAMRAAAGEASDFEVQLATLAAGELHNAAANDSLEYLDAALALQTVMGIATDSVRITLTDSLTVPSIASAARQGGALLPVGAAQADLDAAEAFARLERRNKWAPPSLSLGYDTRDPGGTGNKLLPAIGLSLPIPLLNGNQGAVAVAEAERNRARAALQLATADANAAVTRTARARDLALARVQRGQGLVAAANRVAAMSLTAYREGAAPLASVLEAQRTARETLAAYVDDLARAWIASATLRAISLTVSPDSTP